MLVYIDKCDCYPLYEVGGVGKECDIPEDKIDWIRQVENDYKEVQEYLRQLYYEENHENLF